MLGWCCQTPFRSQNQNIRISIPSSIIVVSSSNGSAMYLGGQDNPKSYHFYISIKITILTAPPSALLINGPKTKGFGRPL